MRCNDQFAAGYILAGLKHTALGNLSLDSYTGPEETVKPRGRTMISFVGIAWYPSVSPVGLGADPDIQLTSVVVGTSAPLSGCGLDGI